MRRREASAGQDANRNNTNPDWSPDGKTIVYSSQDVPLAP